MKRHYIIRGMPEVLTNLISEMLVNDFGAEQMSENQGLDEDQCYFMGDWALTLRTGTFINSITVFGKDASDIDRRKSQLEEQTKCRHGAYLGLEEK